MASVEEYLAKLKQKKKMLKASLTRAENFFKGVDSSNIDIDEIELRINKAEETWKSLSEVQMEIGRVKDNASDDEGLEKEMEDCENKFLHLKLVATKLIKNNMGLGVIDENYEQVAQRVPDNSQRNTRNNYNNCVRLPKIELPTFSGLYEDWHTFYDVFKSLIHSNDSLNDVQRFHYLKSALKGEAAETISSLEISGLNYENAWTRLQERYDNQRLIIQTHIKAIFDLPIVRKENGTAIRQVLDGVLKHTRALQALKRPTHQWDDLLIHIVTGKLDISSIKEWENTLESTLMPSFQELIAFLNKRCQTLEAVANRNQQSQTSTGSRVTGHNKFTAALATTSNVKCPYCKDNHQIYRCKAFHALPVSERANQVKLKGLCLNCLRGNHKAKECVAVGCKICKKKHNSLLHFKNDKEKENEEEQLCQKVEQDTSKEKEKLDSVSCHHAKSEGIGKSKQVLLATAIVKIKNKDGRFIEARALLDSGSQSNFVSENFVNKLGICGSKTQIKINGINQQVSNALKVVDLNVSSRFESFRTSLKCVILPCITQDLPTVQIDRSEINISKNIRLADPEFHVPKKIDLLMGAERFWDLMCVGQIKLGKAKLTLQKSTLGWIISGVIETRNDKVLQTTCGFSTEQDLCNAINRFWQLEDCLSPKSLNDEDEYVEEHFKNNYVRNVEGRFVVKLPVNQKVLDQLGESRDVAMRRLKSLERKFTKAPDLKSEYVNFMKEYIEVGHMKVVAEPDLKAKRIFLPHQAVVREDASTTKTRVVFDASSKDSKGLSLNDALYKGPVIQSDLFSVIMRFRCFKYVICADIKKMYRQVLVHEDHTLLQTILWREDPSMQVQQFELLTLAEIEKENFPLASKSILSNFYVDDLLTGSDTVQGIADLKEQLTELLSRGGFELHKWKSNIMPPISEIKVDNKSVDLSKEEESKLLGILWKPDKDVLSYKSPLAKLENKITKRVMLSEISKLFDPLGLVGPVITAAKILVQSLWACNIGWDESVPMSIHKAWCKIKSQLYLLEYLEIPRLIITKDSGSNIQLHGFSDASEQAYGACIYLKEDEGVTALLCSKSRVAPLKVLSLPRLELCGAVLLMKLMNKVVTSLNVSVRKRYYWTDSKIVLAWLRSPARRWKTFVANRIGEIQNNSSSSEWHHVKSKENPADLISRGLTPERLKDSDLWWRGPEWLKYNESEWPLENAELSSEALIERRAETTVATTYVSEPIISYNRYSSLSKLLRIIAYVRRFAHNAKCEKENRKTGCVSVLEISEARIDLVKMVQREEFENEIRLLLRNENVPKTSKLISLKPYLDKNNVIRVGGRLENSGLPEATRHPIIMPSSHLITKLIIKDKHERLFHAGTQATLASVREEFWPLAARSSVKGIIRKCVRCVKASPMPSHQIMGQLPTYRVNQARPFYNTGVDYCGPFLVRDRVRRNSKLYKTYVAVFVCMVTKAVHLELVEDMSSEAFIGALKRFIARRGKIVNIYSDNGKNFQGADNELQRLFKNAEFCTALQQAASEERLTWHFIPPRAPHFGRLWEAAVRSMKRCLKKVVGNASLTMMEMITALSQVEAVLNSRPLTPVSDDPMDLSVLTPAHFLIGDSLTSYPEPDLQQLPLNRLSRWQLVERLKQHFWSRWSKEYLTACQGRTKWKSDSRVGFHVGHLVMLKEDEAMPLRWVLARIVEVHPGPDGVIRTATVRASKGIYKRPIVKICPLPQEDCEVDKTD